MRYFELEPGESAPEGADRLIITKLQTGRFQVDAVVARRAGEAFSRAGPFASEEEALDAGFSGAAEAGSSLIFLERRSA